MKMEINNIEDINEVSGLLHDATISFDEIVFEKNTQLFEAVFNRHMWENTKRRGIFKRMKMQAVHSRLTFKNVTSMTIDTEQESYPINEVNCIEMHDSKVNIIFHNDVIITLEVQNYNGKLEDLNEPWDIEGPFSLSFGKDA